VLGDAKVENRTPYRPITHDPFTFVALMYTRETRLPGQSALCNW
jgi:hypothetical protein